MKIDFKRLYRSRLEEITSQIALAIRHKDWAVKKKLEAEKEELLKKIDMG